ncbi:hypothetical protein HW561_00465 [Rhodobacteraceae bacterium B1Z28]|uniref:Uncharacterized protein n=1 Tax=Ruegeria haliotis TaxID=2747601 RepID=A0ABX2PJH8_9RHOB|nr:hypothetical protein [Ruegeria haliotis]NVO54263.1 hypothetical protein [Ruegeria haliotis]
MDTVALDSLLLDAHSRNDHANLVYYYTLAADERERAGDTDAACFYLTHAFVFALEAGAPEADALNARLVGYGRAHSLDF